MQAYSLPDGWRAGPGIGSRNLGRPRDHLCENINGVAPETSKQAHHDVLGYIPEYHDPTDFTNIM